MSRIMNRPTDEQIIEIYNREPALTYWQIATELGISKKTLSSRVTVLSRNGKIVRRRKELLSYGESLRCQRIDTEIKRREGVGLVDY